MVKRALAIADPLEQIKPASDSSLMMLLELRSRGFQIFWATERDLVWKEKSLKIGASEITEIKTDHLPKVGDANPMSVEDFQVILVRKDPPFNGQYLRMCWLLAPYEKQIKMINLPSLLLRYHEKFFALEGLAKSVFETSDFIPTFLGARVEQALEEVKKWKDEFIVLKPWLGHGGREIAKISRDDFIKNPQKFWIEKEDWILQPFKPSIETQGDYRAFFIDGKYEGGFARLPKPGHFISNLAQGGTPKVRELTEDEKKIIHKIEKWLKEVGLLFVGADLIGGKINEINNTSPTGLVSYTELTGIDLSQKIMDHLLK